jgi:hypothetical protein
MSAWPIAVLILAGAVAPGMARADVYSYTDSNGVTHFSNVPLDSRYQLQITTTPREAVVALPKDKSIDWLARSAQYDGVIRSAAKDAKIQAELVRAVIVVGSGFNPRAVSKQGKVGLMQLMPATAKRYGVKDIYDPEQNVRAGARYLSDLLDRFDSNLELALAAYNAGEETVERYGRHVPPFRETLAYVPSVMRVYQRLIDQAVVALPKDKSQAESIPRIREGGTSSVAAPRTGGGGRGNQSILSALILPAAIVVVLFMIYRLTRTGMTMHEEESRTGRGGARTFSVLVTLVLIVGGWHYLCQSVLETSLTEGTNEYLRQHLRDATARVDINPISNLVVIRVERRARKTAGLMDLIGDVFVEGVRQQLEPLLERQLSANARGNIDLYAMLVPYQASIVIEPPT